MEKLFQLLTEQDEIIVLKTLGLIRNLLCNRPHIDYIMSLYGTRIIQAIIMILESDYYTMAIKEIALCILANVADGATSKEFIIGNEDLLRKINSFMVKYIFNCINYSFI
jgi:armadillo repeat-containing protein 8